MRSVSRDSGTDLTPVYIAVGLLGHCVYPLNPCVNHDHFFDNGHGFKGNGAYECRDFLSIITTKVLSYHHLHHIIPLRPKSPFLIPPIALLKKSRGFMPPAYIARFWRSEAFLLG